MSTVKVTPDDLRTAAEAYVQAASDISGASGAPDPATDVSVRLNGQGEHTGQNLSTQGFGPGEHAKLLFMEALRGYGEAATALQVNSRGLASALHILADVFTSADHEEALAFAFMEPGAAPPAGLPSYIDPETSLWGQWDEHQEKGENSEEAGDNPFRSLVDSGADGQDGAPRTDSYWVHVPPDRGVPYLVTRKEYYDSDGALRSTDYVHEYSDGSTYYYTEDSDGKTIDEWYVPAQPDAPEFGAATEQEIERAQEEMEQLGN